MDVKEIINCGYFVLNLNGRYYDEGAMAEAGIAFATGKPIVAYHNDLRDFSPAGPPPALAAICLKRVNNYKNLPEALDGLNKSSEITLSERLIKDYKSGTEHSRIISKFSKPYNDMYNWLGGKDE